MIRCPFFTLLSGLSLLATPLLAQTEVPTPPHCPLAIQGGPWNLDIIQVDDGISAQGNTVPTPALGEGVTMLPSCNGDLTIQTPGASVTLSGSSLGTYPAEYQGTGTLVATVTAEWFVVLASPNEARGRLSLGGTFNRVVNGEALHYQITYDGDVDGNDPACNCPDHLRAALQDQIDDARRLQALFANQHYRLRPANFSPDVTDARRWRSRTYLAVINLMYHQGMTFEDATAYVDEHTNDGGLYVPPSDDPSPDDLYHTSGETDWDRFRGCEIRMSPGNASCYPEIEYNAVYAHEEVHLVECEANGGIHNTIDARADSEVRAYQAEIDFYANWIPNNCSGPIPNVQN